jgi:hypothetical protein
VDKANPDEWMAGYPLAQLRRNDGVVMTLYDGPEHPFIHALQSREAWALCIDLPVIAGTDRTSWGLTQSADGRSVFAANGAAGVVVDVDPNEYAVRRTALAGGATAGAGAGAGIVLAKFGHSDVGPIGERVVVLPDSSRLLLGTSDGVELIDSMDLRKVGRVETGTTVESLGVTPDGSMAFALTRDGRIVAFDLRGSGAPYGDVAGGPYSGLLAVAPW